MPHTAQGASMTKMSDCFPLDTHRYNRRRGESTAPGEERAALRGLQPRHPDCFLGNNQGCFESRTEESAACRLTPNRYDALGCYPLAYCLPTVYRWDKVTVRVLGTGESCAND